MGGGPSTPLLSAQDAWGASGLIGLVPYRAGADANMQGKQGTEELFAVGKGVLAAATSQVFMDGHEGSEPESGVDHAQDEGVGLRLRLAVGAGYGTFEAKFRGQPTKPEDGERDGQFSAEGIDATPETAESSHFRIHLIINLGNGVGFRGWRADCCWEGRPNFLVSLSIPLICARYGGLVNVDARTGLKADLRGWRMGWERLVVGR